MKVAPPRRTVWALIVMGIGCGVADRGPAADRSDQPAAHLSTQASTGTIRGVVTLRGSGPPTRSEPVSQQQNVCGTSVGVTRLSLGAKGGVGRAIVSLDEVPAGAGPSRPPRPVVVVEQKDCQYTPGALVVSPGTPIDIVNDDPILHNVHAREQTADGLRTVFNIAQPIRGQRTRVSVPLTRSGVVELSCEAGHPWMSAYMLVASHDFATVTDQDGAFVIDKVPVGTYPLTMWHQGVTLTRVIPSLQRFEYEAPYQATEQVVVRPNEETVVNFALQLRSSPPDH
jgi:plastocyanin